MLKISQVKEYADAIKAEFTEIKSSKIVVTADELAKFLKDHAPEDNILMLSLVPEHGVSGSDGAAKWVNTYGVYFIEKTDYSEHDHDGFLDIFIRTQLVAEKFINKLLEDKLDNAGLFCGFLAWLDENAITASPVKAFNGCNGYYVEVSLKSNP